MTIAAPKRDNLFGICAALGADFGFDPFYLRIALAIGVIAAPEAVLIAYGGAGLLVLLSRLLTRGGGKRAHTADIRTIAPATSHADVVESAPLRRAA